MVWHSSLRRYTYHMELNPTKVNSVLKLLNGGKIKGDWIAAQGFHVIPAADIKESGTFNSDFSIGAPLQLFFNVKTGETRLYLVSRLTK